ncbi:hypothetical protein GPJ57_01630 [Burkholderia pseudomallei]|nr:hypothetical protein [Burkholderia pseudomallei]
MRRASVPAPPSFSSRPSSVSCYARSGAERSRHAQCLLPYPRRATPDRASPDRPSREAPRRTARPFRSDR